MTKKCTRCGEEKELEEFGSKKSSIDGRDTRCKKCLAEIKREWVARPKKEKEVIQDGFHKCSKCGEIKPIETFHKRARCKDGYSHTCLVCDNKYNAEWKEEHRDQHLATRRAWYNANIETERKRILAYHKKNYKVLYAKYREWVANNREHHNNTQRLYLRNLAKIDPYYYLTKRCRGRILAAVKSADKAANTAELLGTSIQYFREYITQQFTDGMTWEAFMNGEIELDHIKPVASFDFGNPINQYICFNYRNHQPLWCKDNRSKSAKWSSGSQLLWDNSIGKDILSDLQERGISDSSYEGC